MKLIIDLPDDVYEQVKETWTIHTQDYVVVSLYRAVKSGKSFEERPKGNWIICNQDSSGIHEIQCPLCKFKKGSDFEPYITVTFDKLPPFCESCGAELTEKESELCPCITCKHPDTKKDCLNCEKWNNWCKED